NAAIQRISDTQTAARVYAKVSWKIELTRAAAAPAEFGNASPLQVANHHLVPMRIGDEEPVSLKCQAAGALQVARDLEPYPRFPVEGDCPAQLGVSHKIHLALPRNRYGRFEAEFVHRLPTGPFLLAELQQGDAAGSEVSNQQIACLVQGQGERLV